MGFARIAVVANKWWEANPLCAVFLDDRARPAAFRAFEIQNYPTFRSQRPRERQPDPKPTPRLSFGCDDSRIELWCLEELMNPSENSSSSWEKDRVLRAAFESRGQPDLVVAFGTAGSRVGLLSNGSVVIGARVFIHNPLADENREKLWKLPVADRVLDSKFQPDDFRNISAEFRYQAEARFIPAPVAPATPPLVVLGNGLISLGVVNITNYDEYGWADKTAIASFEQQNVKNGHIGSIETTHGVIRSCSEAPFIYVSGLVDMEGVFDYQVTPRVYAQNFCGAHNAAVALAWLIPQLTVRGSACGCT